MPSTPNYGIPYPPAAQKPNIAADMAAIAAQVDAVVKSIPIGASFEWDYGTGQIPSWGILQYGQAVSRTTYAALHALASAATYPHGNGDGSTTFNIADKRGRISVGKDDMGGTAANRITAGLSGNGTVLGLAIGSEGVTLATAGMPSHNHGGNTGNISADHSHSGTSGGRDTAHNHADGGHLHNPGISANTMDGWIGDDTTGYYSGGNGAPIGPHYGGGPWYQNNTGYISSTGENAEHTHGTTTGGIDTNHTHPITAEGGGGAHLNTQPTIIANRIVRAL